jgi:predicted component of type VI protein secretion system
LRYWAKGLLIRAKAALEALVAPHRARRLVSQAQAALREKDLDKAAILLEEAREQHPGNRKAQRLWSWVQEQRRADARVRYYDSSSRGWLPAGRSALKFDAPYILEIVQGSQLGIWQPLFSGMRLTMGRSTRCEFVLSDRWVSREHAMLICEDQRCQIEDRGSLNGTYVNGEQIVTMCSIRPGDHLRLGNTVLRLVATRPTPPVGLQRTR